MNSKRFFQETEDYLSLNRILMKNALDKEDISALWKWSYHIADVLRELDTALLSLEEVLKHNFHLSPNASAAVELLKKEESKIKKINGKILRKLC